MVDNEHENYPTLNLNTNYSKVLTSVYLFDIFKTKIHIFHSYSRVSIKGFLWDKENGSFKTGALSKEVQFI